jgi:hypothetical protein
LNLPNILTSCQFRYNGPQIYLRSISVKAPGNIQLAVPMRHSYVCWVASVTARRDGLCALYCGLPAGKARARSVVMWQAFVDESGDRQHAPIFVLGGFAATIPQWKAFGPEWQKMLDMKPGITHFKMNDAATFKKEFLDWSESRRDERVRLAYYTAEEHVSFQVSCIIDIEALDRIFPTNPDNGKLLNPYLVAFSALVTHVAENQEKFGVREKMDFIFDDRAMEKGKIVDAWDELKAFAPPHIGRLMGNTPAFQDDRDVLPLQAADLLAWWVRKLRTEDPDRAGKVVLPWKARRNIPGVQINMDEKRLLKIREAKASPVVSSSAEKPSS